MERLVSERLVLRQWTIEDAEDCYKHAKDERIGPNAGWTPHKSVEESKEIIQTIFTAPETYAICFKEDLKPIGCIGILVGKSSFIAGLSDDEGEIGYWVGHDYWGRGIATEAVLRLERHAFQDLGLKRLWGRYMSTNLRSGRVLRKGGLEHKYDREEYNEIKGGHIQVHVLCIERENWESHNKAK